MRLALTAFLQTIASVAGVLLSVGGLAFVNGIRAANESMESIVRAYDPRQEQLAVPETDPELARFKTWYEVAQKALNNVKVGKRRALLTFLLMVVSPGILTFCFSFAGLATTSDSTMGCALFFEIAPLVALAVEILGFVVLVYVFYLASNVTTYSLELGQKRHQVKP